jgi:dTDP-glucose 4,6-dehydratase
LVRAWRETYGLPAIVTNCSNNYGPYHFPEKLVPHIIIKSLAEEPLPVYGDGGNIRDWLYVEDHARALMHILHRGRIGQCYNVSGGNERRNIEVAQMICDLLDDAAPLRGRKSRRELITYVADRPGHDARYAIDGRKLKDELGWEAQERFDHALRATVVWYAANRAWWTPLRQTARKRVGLNA